jgi:hypothetical protein
MGENGMLGVELIFQYKFYELLFDNKITTLHLRHLSILKVCFYDLDV